MQMTSRIYEIRERLAMYYKESVQKVDIYSFILLGFADQESQ